MNHGSWDFFGNVFSRLRMATSEIEVAFGGWGGALEDMKSSTKIAPAHVSSITPASQISLRKFCSSFCYLLFIDSPTSKPPRVGFAVWASPKPKPFHLRDIPILPPSFSGPENTVELMRENCFIIQGNKLSQLSHLQPFHATSQNGYSLYVKGIPILKNTQNLCVRYLQKSLVKKKLGFSSPFKW